MKMKKKEKKGGGEIVLLNYYKITLYHTAKNKGLKSEEEKKRLKTSAEAILTQTYNTHF